MLLAVIPVTASWLADQGAGPYVLDQSDTTYVLETDVATEGSAFIIEGNDIIFDLNGHTIRYDQGAFGLSNGDFEITEGQEQAPSGWDMTDAPGASRTSTFDEPLVGEWYLNVEQRNQDQTIVSDWTSLPPSTEAVAHFVRGDSASKYHIPVQLEVEHETLGVIAGFLDSREYMLTFTTPDTPGRYRLKWTWKYEDYPTWQADHAYQIGDIVLPTASTGAVYQLQSVDGQTKSPSNSTEPDWPTTLGATVADGNLTWQVFRSNTSDYMSTWEPNHEYGLGSYVRPTNVNGFAYKVVNVAIAGSVSGDAEPSWVLPPAPSISTTADNNLQWRIIHLTDAHIDLLDLRTTGQYGILSQFGQDPANVTISNGAIEQGQAAGFRSHAINIYGRDSVTTDHLTINTVGVEAAGIWSLYSHEMVVSDNTITTANPHKFNRHQLSAAISVFHTTNTSILRNNVTSGRGWGGICANGDNLLAAENSVWTQSVITNHYGIKLFGNYNTIRNNHVDADPGQGIRSDGEHNVIEGNTVIIRSVAPNWDVGYLSLDAIRLNDYYNGYNNDIVVRDNEIWLYGQNSPLYETQSQLVCGIANVTSGSGIVYERNYIRAVKADPEVTVCGIRPGSKDEMVLWQDNTIESDEYNVLFGSYPTYSFNNRFVDNTFIKGSNAVADYATIAADVRTTATFMQNTHFIGTTLLNGATLRDPDIASWGLYSYEVGHRLTVLVNDENGSPVSDALVTVNRGTETVASGQSDATGAVQDFELPEFDLAATGQVDTPYDYTEYNPYTVSVTVDGQTISKTIRLERNSTVVVNLPDINGVPVLDPVVPQTVHRGDTLSLAVTAFDPDSPSQNLTYSLEAGAPSGASIDPSSGIFSWTPDSSVASGTYQVGVRVSDHGAPSLFDAISIEITVPEEPCEPVALVGTDGDDKIEFWSTQSKHFVRINGIEHELDRASVSGIYLDARAGIDTITITGTDADETVFLETGSVDFSWPSENVTFRATSVENITVDAGVGGNDQATLSGSTASNRLHSYDDYSVFTDVTDSFTHRVSGFASIEVIASDVALDYAYLHGSIGDDVFLGTPGKAVLNRNLGAECETAITATGFEWVYGYGSQGGVDQAMLNVSSSTSNRFYSYSDHSVLSDASRSFYLHVADFESVTARAEGDANGRALFYDGPGADTFTASVTTATRDWNGASEATSFGFGQVFAYGSTDDVAELAGGDTGSNRFHSNLGSAALWNASFYQYARGFESLTARGGSGGNNVAYLNDSVLGDVLNLGPGYGELDYGGDGTLDVRALAFDQIRAQLLKGGSDTVSLTDSDGIDHYTGAGTTGRLTDGANYWIDLYFDDLGDDQVTLYFSDTEDTADADPANLEYLLMLVSP